MSLDETKQPELNGEATEETVAPAEEPVTEHKAEIVYGFGTPEEVTEEKDETDNRFSAFDAPTVQEKAKKAGKMHKRTRTLLLTSLVAIILALAVLAVTLLPQFISDGGSESSSVSGGDTSTDTTESYPLIDKTTKDENVVVVKQVQVTNKDDTFTMVYNTKDKLYQLKGYEDLSLEADGTDSITGCIAQLTAVDKVDSAGNPADFGLDKPAATVIATYHDDTTATLYIGNKTPSANGYYVSVKDKEGIYICSSDSVDVFLATGSMYVETTLLAAPEVKKDDANGTPILREVTLSGKSHPQPLTIRRRVEADGDAFTFYTYIITQPYKRGAAETAGNELSSFYALTADQALILHPTDKQKAEMGFNDPLTVMNITVCVATAAEQNSSTTSTEDAATEFYNTAKTTFTIGSKDKDGNYLVMMKGVDAIFLVSSTSLNVVAERTYDNTVTDLLFLKDITEVKQVNITVNGVEHKMNLAHYPEKEDRDQTLVVTEGDKTYKTPDFRTLYQLMMSLSRYEPLDKKPTGEPALKIALIGSDGKPYLSADFYSATGSLYHVCTSEGELFATKASGITHFIKQVNNLIEGKTVLVETY
ncbi:MAG: DUF4340 domain-containing protein [Clostridia bacterium]|nr:DUF4340 domain-containing protein [Clostridia bacterium]